MSDTVMIEVPSTGRMLECCAGIAADGIVTFITALRIQPVEPQVRVIRRVRVEGLALRRPRPRSGRGSGGRARSSRAGPFGAWHASVFSAGISSRAVGCQLSARTAPLTRPLPRRSGGEEDLHVAVWGSHLETKNRSRPVSRVLSRGASRPRGGGHSSGPRVAARLERAVPEG